MYVKNDDFNSNSNEISFLRREISFPQDISWKFMPSMNDEASIELIIQGFYTLF